MVSWCFGARWFGFGFRGSPYEKGLLVRGALIESQTTGPQTTNLLLVDYGKLPLNHHLWRISSELTYPLHFVPAITLCLMETCPFFLCLMDAWPCLATDLGHSCEWVQGRIILFITPGVRGNVFLIKPRWFEIQDSWSSVIGIKMNHLKHSIRFQCLYPRVKVYGTNPLCIAWW